MVVITSLLSGPWLVLRIQPVLRELQQVAAGAIRWIKKTPGECWDGPGGWGGNPSFSFGQVELEVFEIPGEISRGQLGMRIAGVVRLDMHL